MRCFIPHEDEYLSFRTVEEAREWLSDPVNIEEFFGEYDDDYYVELLWDKDYEEYEDWVHIDGWALRQIRLLLGIPLKGTGYPWIILDERRFEEFDNYEDFANRDRELNPSQWKKAKGLRAGKKRIMRRDDRV